MMLSNSAIGPLKSSVFGLIREPDLKRLINEKVEKPCAKVARRSPTCPPNFISDPPKLVVYSDEESSEDDDGAIATQKAMLSRLNTMLLRRTLLRRCFLVAAKDGDCRNCNPNLIKANV
jgi:hypothetical protein